MSTALIVTDMQNGFMNKYTRHLPLKIKQLLERQLFKVVIFTQFLNSPTSPYVQLLGYKGLQRSPETEIVPELRPYAQIVFSKYNYTPFAPDFEAFLKRKNIIHLYFVGVDTNACVQVGAVDAFNKSYIPHVLARYCASHSGREFHALAIKNLKKLIGTKQVIEQKDKKLMV